MTHGTLTGHTCSYAHCHEAATHVMVESAAKRGRTFHEGAGLTCERHAKESEQDGCKAWGGG